MGANFLAKYNGGSGVLLGGVPGILPGHIILVGGEVPRVSMRPEWLLVWRRRNDP